MLLNNITSYAWQRNSAATLVVVASCYSPGFVACPFLAFPTRTRAWQNCLHGAGLGAWQRLPLTTVSQLHHASGSPVRVRWIRRMLQRQQHPLLSPQPLSAAAAAAWGSPPLSSCHALPCCPRCMASCRCSAAHVCAVPPPWPPPCSMWQWPQSMLGMRLSEKSAWSCASG